MLSIVNDASNDIGYSEESSADVEKKKNEIWKEGRQERFVRIKGYNSRWRHQRPKVKMRETKKYRTREKAISCARCRTVRCEARACDRTRMRVSATEAKSVFWPMA